MPTQLAVDQIYEFTVYISDRSPANTPTQCAVLRRYYRVFEVGAGSTLTEQDAIDAMEAAFAVLYKPAINTLAYYNGASLQLRTPFFLPPVPVNSLATAGVGSGGAIAMAKQTAGLIKLTTDYIGKTRRGRQYVPFPSVSQDQGNGVPTAAYLVTLVNLATALSSTVTVSTGGAPPLVKLTPIIWNPAVPGTYFGIVDFVVRERWATQKRRGDFGRANLSPI